MTPLTSSELAELERLTEQLQGSTTVDIEPHWPVSLLAASANALPRLIAEVRELRAKVSDKERDWLRNYKITAGGEQRTAAQWVSLALSLRVLPGKGSDMTDHAELERILAQLKAFLLAHNNEPGSLSVALLADESQPEWDMSLGSLRALADAIASLRASEQRMREALEKIAEQLVCSQGRGKTDPNVICYCPNCDRSLGYARSIAIAALFRPASEEQKEENDG